MQMAASVVSIREGVRMRCGLYQLARCVPDVLRCTVFCFYDLRLFCYSGLAIALHI